MQIKCTIVIDEVIDVFDLTASSVREVLSLVKIQKGSDYLDTITQGKFHYLLKDKDGNIIQLTDETIFSDLTDYSELLILQDIEGNDPMSIGFAIGWALTDMGLATAGAFVLGNAWIIGAIAMVGITVGMNMLMTALSPTPEFSNDPAATQNKSNLFNGAPIIRDQGGSVPLIFGNPYAGAVLISSGAFTEEVAV